MFNHDLDKIYCAAIKRGEIYLVADENDKNEQLMVAVQDNILNERLTTVLSVPVEVHKDRGVYKNELQLKPSETSLNKTAACVPHKLCAINRHRFRAKTGELSKERLQELYQIMDINFGRFRDKS